MPSRKRLKANATPSKTRRSGRRRKGAEDEVPQLFQEMLAEAAMSSRNDEPANDRPIKRRRVSPEPTLELETNVDVPVSSPAPPQAESRPQQIVYDDFGSSEDGSDVEFEDVEIENDSEEEECPEQKSLQLDLSSKPPPRPTVQRRKPVSKAERDYRLNVHKAHLLLLLMNLQLRRRWCENEEVQAILKPLISSKLRNMLHVGNEKPAYQRSHSFNKAIEEICTIWWDEFEITGPGMRSAYWKEDIDALREVDEFDDPSDHASFLTAAETRHGSRDLGATLFCALLRSAAVETRLVCSLQVLPFSAVAKGQTPEKAKSEYVYRTAWPTQEYTPTHEDPTNARWRQSEYAGVSAPVPKSGPVKNKIHDSPYPIFWVEVLLPTDTWIPLDPLVRKTINKPKTGFEPPLSEHLNSMSYVIAFEETGYAKDVTRRYAQFFNAKTRKQRVESTKHGDYWWSTTMQWFRKFKPRRLESDIIEDLELDQKSKNEPMPKNISDFKNHPVFALERNLRRNEVVWPNEHRGKISAGNKNGKSEKVYDRKNVHVVRSADQWYRKGRDIKIGEQPLKRVVKQKRRDISVDEDVDSEIQDGTLLYAEFQTEIYVPPPVVKGRIPKNQYGNLDVYVPSMIPPGAIHLQHPEARKAAIILGVHFTDAVTGFKFKGRQGTAVVNGIVAAAEYRDALVEVVEALEYERVREQEEKRSLIALATWKKFMTALRIKQRIHEEHAEHDDEIEDVDRSVAGSMGSEDESSAYNDSGNDVGGGFMPDAGAGAGEGEEVDAIDLAKLTLDAQQAVYHEVIVVESPHTHPSEQLATKIGQTTKSVPSLLPKDSLFDDDDEEELFNGVGDEPGGFMQESDEVLEGGGFVAEDEGSADGGGFVRDEDADGTGGGFLVEESTTGPGEPAINRKVESPRIHDKQPVAELPPSLEGEQPSSIHQEAAGPADRPAVSVGDIDHDEDEEEKDDDGTSLLSHDPDDDNMEEEWTMDIDSE
jgi:xeroderma pigmentosum group C-complementing protein